MPVRHRRENDGIAIIFILVLIVFRVYEDGER